MPNNSNKKKLDTIILSDFTRKTIISKTHADEHEFISQILHEIEATEINKSNEKALKNAKVLVTSCRKDKHGKGTLDAFLQEFGLSNQEGVALMCLAEALLRIPDKNTADRLIAEKLQHGDWIDHLGKSESLFVNASTWGLILTGNIVNLDIGITDTTVNWYKKLISSMGEPIIRVAVLQAMRIMGQQYVLGETINQGLRQGQKNNSIDTRFSFDMLGEGARTKKDAQKYYEAYLKAISEIHFFNQPASNVYDANGISIKLSALYPRYVFSHKQQTMKYLYPKIKSLCLVAKEYGIGLSIDAEEAKRLELSLDIFERLAKDEELQHWHGLGFVLQAYQKRSPYVAKWLIELAKETNRRIMVRLVKGAYWDAEIKEAQEQGFADYPVFTRKVNTDLCYQYCASILLSAPTAIFPQFATHNAYTISYILEIAQDHAFEFQRLHGMGEILYKQVKAQYPERNINVRVYAPIGNHKDLLPYLVRRLLENGANNSFVNRFLDNKVPIDELLQDVSLLVKNTSLSKNPHRNPQISKPLDIFNSVNEFRNNAKGINLDCPEETQELLSVIQPLNLQELVADSTKEEVIKALENTHKAQLSWQELEISKRAEILRTVADNLEKQMPKLIGIIVKEAKRTINDALSEVREAIDFCRYYAIQAEILMQNPASLTQSKATLVLNKDSKFTPHLVPKGVVFCISPWNFPLAIFVGQIAAALVTGNTVIAKPAEQTPRVAIEAIKLFYAAGVPKNVLQLVLGKGAEIGGWILTDNRIDGVIFTGSTETAQIINKQLAQQPKSISLLAETGGINCLIADSTSLPEQLIDDIIASAFQSAGQRCSALRVLFIQRDIADSVIQMLAGAIQCLTIDSPEKLHSDIGPVIDQTAANSLNKYITDTAKTNPLLATTHIHSDVQQTGSTYIAPHVFEIENLNQLKKEVFGPVLHIIRFDADKLDQVIAQINHSGYALTLGIHSRIQAFADYVYTHTQVGNTYINRNIIGAVVGVNPFGGRGLSGTGPKAGGPNYLSAFLNLQKESLNIPKVKNKIVDLEQYAHLFKHLIANNIAPSLKLPSPTGEDNTLTLYPKHTAICLIHEHDTNAESLIQIIAALTCGCEVKVNAEINLQPLHSMDLALENLTIIAQDAKEMVINESCDIICCTPNSTKNNDIKIILANQSTLIIPMIELMSIWSIEDTGAWYAYLLNFFYEKTKTDNLVAKGGNTHLLNLSS